MYKFMKRFIDILISFSVLFILAPFLSVLVIILKMTGEHRVMFKQDRIGYKLENFGLYKFVTMRSSNSPIPENAFSPSNYSRVTPLGKFLRFTKINELPQLFNVLKGDMSLVGPRPLISVSFDMYPKEVKDKIYFLKPGLTGIGSIVFRDEEKYFANAASDMEEYYKTNIIPYKGTLETWYYDNQSFRLDIIILFLTTVAIILPKLKLHYKVLRKLPVEKKQMLIEIDKEPHYKSPPHHHI